MSTISDSIVFIDEGNDFLPTVAFAEAVQKSDNYYVIVAREGLPNLPYSVEEIYGIKTSGKYTNIQQVYHEFYHLYGRNITEKQISADVIIVEDSNSGYEFFAAVSQEEGRMVISAKGKSNFFKLLQGYNERTVLVIADGAHLLQELQKILICGIQKAGLMNFIYTKETESLFLTA